MERDDELSSVREAVQNGVDLRAYSSQIEDELYHIESESVQDCSSSFISLLIGFVDVSNIEEASTLHSEIKNCDDILCKMESLLQGFQEDLGQISEEIKHLQKQSFSLNIQLKNRQNVENKLSHFIKGNYQ